MFLYYNLIKNYRETYQVKKHLKNIKVDLSEYKWHKKLLEERLKLDKENLEKIIVIYEEFITKILKILNNLTK